ncbi:hypothetical protein EU546_01335 [Candidatus Thorarchaeota archaeon]|nr:MAG: hypothetical protein EU546_01335 [Candidatus Thorarchaeota archaeon]
MLDLDVTFARLTNPRMSAGLMVLHSLLERVRGEPVEPKEVRKDVDKKIPKRTLSKQSVTNAARRLEEAGMLVREESKYTVNHGFLISVLLDNLISLNERVGELEDEIHQLKSADR